MSYVPNDRPLRQREPRVRDKAYLGWLHDGLACVSCSVHGRYGRAEHAAHIKVGFPEAGWRAFGHAEKSHDSRAAPLCASCHQHGSDAQHKNRGGDERSWWERLGVYPPDFCEALYAAFQNGEDGNAVIRKAGRGEFPFPD